MQSLEEKDPRQQRNRDKLEERKTALHEVFRDSSLGQQALRERMFIQATCENQPNIALISRAFNVKKGSLVAGLTNSAP